MDYSSISAEGDLPPDHPLVLEALKGIIGGPIAELREKVDKNITNPSSTLRKGEINYENILPIGKTGNNPSSHNYANQREVEISNNIIKSIEAPSQVKISKQEFTLSPNLNSSEEDDKDQMELALFKQAEISDLYNKMFDLEKKLDIIISYVKPVKGQK